MVRRTTVALLGIVSIFGIVTILNTSGDGAERRIAAADARLPSHASDCATGHWPYLPSHCISLDGDKDVLRHPARIIMPENSTRPIVGEPITGQRISETLAALADRPPSNLKATSIGKSDSGKELGKDASTRPPREKDDVAVVFVYRGGERIEFRVLRE
jgi:hypothetical protein